MNCNLHEPSHSLQWAIWPISATFVIAQASPNHLKQTPLVQKRTPHVPRPSTTPFTKQVLPLPRACAVNAAGKNTEHESTLYYVACKQTGHLAVTNVWRSRTPKEEEQNKNSSTPSNQLLLEKDRTKQPYITTFHCTTRYRRANSPYLTRVRGRLTTDLLDKWQLKDSIDGRRLKASRSTGTAHQVASLTPVPRLWTIKFIQPINQFWCVPCDKMCAVCIEKVLRVSGYTRHFDILFVERSQQAGTLLAAQELTSHASIFLPLKGCVLRQLLCCSVAVFILV